MGEVKDTGLMVYGRVPPHSLESEAAVLGAVMLEKGVFVRVSDRLRAELFYSEAHGKVWKTMEELSVNSTPIDLNTVAERLREKKELDALGGLYFLTRLTNDVVSAANIEAHAAIIVDRFIRRELIRIGGALLNSGYSDTDRPVEEIGGAATSALSRLVGVKATGLSDISTLLVKAVQKLEEDRHRESFLVGYNTGYQSLNRVTYGWQPGDLVILAARPSVGKTAFALNLARNMVTTAPGGAGVGIFSIEMTALKLTQRLMAIESGTPLEHIITGRLSEARLQHLHGEGIQKLSDYNIWMDDESTDLLTISAVATKMVEEYGVKVLILDYLQLASHQGEQGGRRGGNREQEIASISRGLKKLAKRLSVTIIALSQLSRAVEGRGSKEPNLADLRESGAIEQDADMVLFLWREDYQQEEATVDPMLKGQAKCKVAKNRNGTLETIPFQFHGETQRWEEDIVPTASMVEGSLRVPRPSELPGPGGGARLFIQQGAGTPPPPQRNFSSLEDVPPDEFPF